MEIRPELWASLESAIQFPATADIGSLCDALDAELSEQPSDKQLAIAGQVLADLCSVCCDRSHLMFEGWEQRHNPKEPVISDYDAEFFVQSSPVTLEDFFEVPGHQYPADRKTSEPEPDEPALDESEVAAVVECQPLSAAAMADQVAALAHGENIEAWTAAIVAFLDRWFAAGNASIPLLELTGYMQMPFMEVWLGLLLGSHNYQMLATGGFYDAAAINVQCKKQ